MRVTAAISALTFAGIAAAQNTVVQVGAEAATSGGIFQFIPPTITATNGSVITFVYSGSPGNHSVTQSSFANPCQPVSGGFDSGFIQIPANTTAGFPSWNLTIVDDTKPIWFYCGQILPFPHCSAGMVGAINAPASGNTYNAFKAAAIATNGTAPGVPVPGLSGVGAAATSAAGPFSGSITGFAIPTGTAPAPSIITTGTVSAAGGSAPAPAPSGSPSPSPSSSAAASVVVNGFAVVISALFGITLL